MNVVPCGSGFKSLGKISRGVLFAILLLLPVVSLGQGYFGTVGGDITDPSGAVIRGAQVTLTDQQKGFTFTATSDAAGHYLFAAVPPGNYSVLVGMHGFQSAERTNIKVNVSENATANVTLQIATATQSVQVQAQTQTLATEDAVTGQVVNRRFINDLPLVDRNIVVLTSLAPGVTEMDDQCDVTCTGTNFSSNGSRGSTSDILTDGASVTNSEPNGGITSATYVPSPEAVEEFKVQQTNFSAEYGFSGASVVNMITRSGTNQFHGSGYDFFRNASLDANNWFNNRAGNPIGPFSRNNFGATVGGPIIKNKTFFFFDYDGLRSAGLSTANAGVPTDAMRNGDFGEVCAAQGGSFDSTGLCSAAAGQIWDPYSGTFDSNAGGAVRTAFIPFNNIANYISPGNPKLPANLQPAPGVPGNLIDPIARQMMSLFPEPNFSGPAGIYQNWVGSGSNSNRNDQFDIKIDHRFGQNNLLSGKFSYQYSTSVGLDCFKNFTDPCRRWSRLDQCPFVRDQRYAHLQSHDGADHDPRIHPRRVAHRRLPSSRRRRSS